MKKILILLVFIVQICAFAQHQIKVVDSLSNKGIPFVAIRFDENNGVYTNDNGEFNMAEITDDKIFLSSMGYKSKSVDIKSIKNNLIYLSPDNFQLDEVHISNKKSKPKIKKVKPEKHNDFRLSHRLIVGAELAILIQNNFNSNDVQLANITIPIVTKTISFDSDKAGKAQRVTKLPFSSLYKITFYENFGGMPGKQLNYETITCIIDEKSATVTINLEKYNISLPYQGIFVGILNLGKTDENGNLKSTSPFELRKNKDGKMVKFVKPTKPYFPVFFEEKTHNTFSRYTFEDNEEWHFFFRHDKIINGEYHNVSLGYEVKLY